MHNSEYLFDVLIFLLAAVIIVPIFRRFRSSPILGYLAAGMIIGPNGLSIIGDTQAAQTLAQFGVVFLLFMIGLELSLERLRTLGSKVFGLGSLQVIVTGTFIGGIVWFLGMGLNAATIIGGGLALSSTAFVLQILMERGERASAFGLSTFSILLLQDIAVVPLLLLITLLGVEGAAFGEAIAMAALKGGAAITGVVIFGQFLLKPLFQIVAGARSPELFISMTLLIILGMGWITSLAGLSMELGALLAGLLLAETEYRHQIEADIRPFRGMLLGLFFMTIGMSIDFSFILANFGTIAIIVVSLLFGKSLITMALSRAFSISLSTSIRVGTALSQGGEFGFVLFGSAMAFDLIPYSVGQILIAVITLSMVATPFMFFTGQKLAKFFEEKENSTGELTIRGEEYSNHVLIAGFGRVGQTIARVLGDAGISYVALDLDQKRVKQCREKDLSVFYGNANQLPVLEAVGAARAKVAVITLDAQSSASKAVEVLRANFEDLPIYVRARDGTHMRKLEEAGATEVVSEAAESSLQLGSIVLSSLNVSADEINCIIAEYREDDYARLQDIVGQQK